MASPKKISELTTAGALTGAELVPVVQNGGTLQTTTSALKVFSLGTVEYQVSTLNLRVDAVSALATQNGYELGELHDVKVSASASLTNGEMLSYNTSAGVWTNTSQLRVDDTNVVVGTGAIATGATSGFLWVAGCAGVPTGIPTTYTGRVPVVVDTTNHRLYFYSGGSWRNAGP